MPPSAIRGRRLLLAVAVAILAPPVLLAVLVMIVTRSLPPLPESLPIVIPAAISWCLYKGYSWARYYVGAVLAIYGLSGIAAAVLQPVPPLVRAAVLVFGFLCCAGVWILLMSASVHAYYNSRNRPHQLSIRGNGV